jgi:hypothetical protein
MKLRLAALLLLLSTPLAADEGMWLFNAPPTQQLKSKYNFTIAPAWLDHVRMSSVRFNNGGSGSFVSPDGLTFTNHHVAQVCIAGLSGQRGQDFMQTGFYAKTRAEEPRCPDLELNMLMSIEDVTEKVTGAAKPDMTAAAKGTAIRSTMSQIEQECTTSTGLRCDVVTLYSGAVYHLYRYKKFTDVRLVFAPEFTAAFFGGDPDNFTYPRYDLDITFFRVYENDKPAQLKDYLKWSASGVNDGDLVFVSGHPGGTDRLLTMAQLEYLRDTEYPWRLKGYQSRIAALKKFAEGSAEKAREAQEDIFGLENSFKAINGEYNDGLKNERLMARKRSEEDQLRAAVNADPKLKAEYGDAWDQLARAAAVHKEIFLPYAYFEGRGALRGDMAGFARILVRAATEKQKPNGERLREYRESALPSLEQQLFSEAPVYKDFDITVVTQSLQEALDQLGRENAVLNQLLAGRSPADAAQQLISGSKLDDAKVRRQLYEGGQAAVDASRDPLIVALRAIDPEARKWRKRYDDEVDAVNRTNGGRIAKAKFSKSGFNQPPDATFTLRLSYGAVKGYPENGKQIPFATNFAGAFQHSAEHQNKEPFNLPASWMSAKSKLNLKTPLNFVHTSDIIGGNSGSPTVNRQGEVVGIIFDGNIQSLPWDFVYDDTQARAVSVDSRGIVEALRNIYNAGALVNELTGGQAAAAAATPASPKKK